MNRGNQTNNTKERRVTNDPNFVYLAIHAYILKIERKERSKYVKADMKNETNYGKNLLHQRSVFLKRPRNLL